MKKINVIIVHGAYGYPEENWFGWMKNELQKLNIHCMVPQLPTPEEQSLTNWLQRFNETCGDHIHQHTILIGHSLGAVFALRWLELYQGKLFAAILAGAFLGEVGVEKFDTLNKDFFNKPFNWPMIKLKSEQFICYHGDNDPYVSKQSFELIANHLGAKKIMISNAGHLNAAAGYTQFPQLLLHLKQIMEIP